MGRFLVVVIILVAIALLANKYLLGEGDVPPVNANAPKADATAEAGDKGTAEPPVTAGEKAAAEAVPSAEVSTDLQQEAGVEPKLPAAEDATGQDISNMLPTEEVLLGDPSLTAGIPGEGDLTDEQIDKYLTDPKNHVILKPHLPLGLAAGEAEI